MSRFPFPVNPTAPADRDDVRLAAELQAIAQDDTRTPAHPQPVERRRPLATRLRRFLRCSPPQWTHRTL